MTLRQYDLHMRGAVKRFERAADLAKWQSYQTAALVGAAMAGKLPKYEAAFGPKIQHGAAQPAAVLDANLNALAKAWGAK